MLYTVMLLSRRCIYVYVYWGESKVVNNKGVPILYSIASLRHFDGSRIVVLDSSNANWENYPDILNFEVVKTKSVERPKNSFLKKLFFVDEFCVDPEIFYVVIDADIIWLRKPTYLRDDCRFQCHKGNTGLYCFRRTPDSNSVIETWKKYSLLAEEDKFLEKRILAHYRSENKNLNEEAVYQYIANYEEKNIGYLPIKNNGMLCTLYNRRWPQDVDNIHFGGNWLNTEDKQKLIIRIKEFYKIIRQYLVVDSPNDPISLSHFMKSKGKI